MKSRLKVLRAERGWTQEQLSQTVGVSRYAINALETERHDPSLDLAFRIAGAFGLAVEAVFPNPHAKPGDTAP
ncbi:helix-turn-helix transcriptional regulator [Caulobacter soli]|uniref:helix-turn-helix transcriptional regulator n=1 Tax=Caulobacter soli TaxID=2708539 RepID=UPI0013ECD4EC|nr:helix-turn-helix transcriptional regulator [Caulobacter soli]